MSTAAQALAGTIYRINASDGIRPTCVEVTARVYDALVREIDDSRVRWAPDGGLLVKCGEDRKVRVTRA